MERVTFHDERLAKRIEETCVPTWRNTAPGFVTATLDDPALQGCRAQLERMAADSPGQASTNVSTVFSLPDGRVLHVAPGHLVATDLAVELDFALAVAAAVERAGPDAGAQALACRTEHLRRERAPSAPQARAHALLSRRPLLPLAELRVEDYAAGELDPEGARKFGLEVMERLGQLGELCPPPGR